MCDKSQHHNLDLTPDFVLLLTESQPRLYGFLLKRLGHPEQTHEVLQEVNLVLCRKQAEFKLGSDFMAWAFSIARFQVLAYQKRQSRDRLVFPENLVSKLDELDSNAFPSESNRAREAALKSCLQSFSASHRELISRRYAESISVQAIAAELGTSANAVSIRLHRLREKLMGCIDQKLSEGFNP